MTLTLKLPDVLERRLTEIAARRGVSADRCAIEILERSLNEKTASNSLNDLLQQWLDEAPASEPDDEDFFRSIDANRPSNRPLYPPELKGITW